MVLIELVAERVKRAQHLVKKREIIVSEQDCETSFGVFGDHERGCLDVNGLEEGVVLGFGVDPVEDFGDLCVVGLVGRVVDKIKQRAYCVSVFIVAIIRNRGDIEIIHYAKGEVKSLISFLVRLFSSLVIAASLALTADQAEQISN